MINSSTRAWDAVLKSQQGKRIFILHDEAGNQHGVVLRVEQIHDGVLEGTTDHGRRYWLRLDSIIKIKSLDGE
jgi:hypothetical protein